MIYLYNIIYKLILSSLKKKRSENLVTTSFILYCTIKYFYLRKKFIYTSGLFQTTNLSIHSLAKITPKSQARHLYSNIRSFIYVYQIYILVLHLNILFCILLSWHLFRFQILVMKFSKMRFQFIRKIPLISKKFEIFLK